MSRFFTSSNRQQAQQPAPLPSQPMQFGQMSSNVASLFGNPFGQQQAPPQPVAKAPAKPSIAPKSMAAKKPTAVKKKPMRSFKVDPDDYLPQRLGVYHRHKAIAVEYLLKSNGKRYNHFIKVRKYTDPAAFGISVSRSGSFKEALTKEVTQIVDSIYGDHCEYLPPEAVDRQMMESLVNCIFNESRRRKNQKLSAWNEIQPSSINQKTKSTIQSTLGASPSPQRPSRGASNQFVSPSQRSSSQGSDLNSANKKHPTNMLKNQSASPARNLTQAAPPKAVASQLNKPAQRRPQSGVPPKQRKVSAGPVTDAWKQKSNISSSLGKDLNASGSGSLLGDLPVPGPTLNNQQKNKANLLAGWDDAGLLESFEDSSPVKKEPLYTKKQPAVEQPTKAKWQPPVPPSTKQQDQPIKMGLRSQQQKAVQQPLAPIRQQQSQDTPTFPVPNQRPFSNQVKAHAYINNEPEEDDGWGEIAPAKIDTKNVDYNKLNLNKLSDWELNKHKAAMEEKYQKNFIGKGDPRFKYDMRQDFTSAQQEAEDSWDEDDIF